VEINIFWGTAAKGSPQPSLALILYQQDVLGTLQQDLPAFFALVDQRFIGSVIGIKPSAG
jgi:hypothetical protein